MKKIFAGIGVAMLTALAGSSALAQFTPDPLITRPPIDAGNLPAPAPDSGTTILLLGIAAGAVLLARHRAVSRAS
ncbi:MAG TPA: VPDSG-CTERM sorting domain-containing protein [Chthoniobacterales bacterium]